MEYTSSVYVVSSLLVQLIIITESTTYKQALTLSFQQSIKSNEDSKNGEVSAFGILLFLTLRPETLVTVYSRWINLEKQL